MDLLALAGTIAGGRIPGDGFVTKAIHAAYAKTDECFERKSVREFAKTVLPGFYAIDWNGHRSSLAQVEASMARRFRIQQECWRDERPMLIKVTGQSAQVTFVCTDEYVWTKPGKGRVMTLERSSGTSYWVETKTGWKQEHRALAGLSNSEMHVEANWHIPKGGWQIRPKLREFQLGR